MCLLLWGVHNGIFWTAKMLLLLARMTHEQMLGTEYSCFKCTSCLRFDAQFGSPSSLNHSNGVLGMPSLKRGQARESWCRCNMRQLTIACVAGPLARQIRAAVWSCRL